MATSQVGPAPPTSLQPLEAPAAHLLAAQGQGCGELLPIDQIIRPSGETNRRFVGGRMQATIACCRHPLIAHALAPLSYASSSNVLDSHATSIYDAIPPHGQSTALRTVLSAIASASLSASVTASDIHRHILNRAQDPNSPHAAEADVLDAAKVLAARPMCAVQVFQYDEVAEQDELVAIWQDLVSRVEPMDIDYVDDAVLALVVGVEPVLRESSVAGSAAFGLRQRYGLLVADNFLIDDEWSEDEHARHSSQFLSLQPLSHSPTRFLKNSTPSIPHALPPVYTPVRSPPNPNLEWSIFASLPRFTVPPQRRQQKLDIPVALHHFFTNTSAYRPRYCNVTGQLAVHGEARNYRVLAHALVLPRQMTAQIQRQYLWVLQAQTAASQPVLFSVMRHLCNRGFGAWDTHSAIQDKMTGRCILASRFVAYLFCRPQYLIASTAREERPDLFNALLHVLDDPGKPVPSNAQLALLVGVECQGLEEPQIDSPVPPEAQRQYALFERVAIVVPVSPNKRRTRPSRQPRSQDSDLSSISDSDSATDYSQARSNTSIHPHSPALVDSAAHLVLPPQDGTLALPQALACLSVVQALPSLRYVAGALHYSSSKSHSSPVLAHALIPARPLTTHLTMLYTAHVEACHSTGVPLTLFKYTMRLGPTNPTSLDDVVRALDDSKGHIHRALHRLVAHPVVLVDQVEDIQEEQQVWALLIRQKKQGQRWPKRVALVKLFGLEMVGFEYPHAEDEVPKWDERRFVVRERWAIVAADDGLDESGSVTIEE